MNLRTNPRLRSRQAVWVCLVTAAICLALGVIWPNQAVPAPPPPANVKHFDEQVRPFLAKHCLECHGAEKPKGKFRADTLSSDFVDKGQREKWLAVLEQLKTGAMPPKGKSRPPEKDAAALTAWIATQTELAEAAQRATQGRVGMRRLNQAEYQNTVRDLLGVDVDLKEILPTDSSTDGFDTNADSLRISSFLMEQYLEAADRVLNAAIASSPKPASLKRRFTIKDERSVKPTGSVYRHLDDAVAIFSSWASANIQVTLWQAYSHREPGKYRVRISSYAFQTDKPVTFHVMTGSFAAVTDSKLVDYFEAPGKEPTVSEFVEYLEGRTTFRVVVDRLGVTPPTVEKIGAQNYKGPGLALQWVEVEGPLHETWPPAGHRRLFGDLSQTRVGTHEHSGQPLLEVVSKDPTADAERILRDFIRRAFRRTVTDEDIKPYLARVKAKLAENYSFEKAVRVGLKSVLVSPEFLFLREKPGKLDDLALASRLSYFLWSSLPDDELLALAEQKKLNQPDTLRQQVERMLKDPKAAAFTENFAGQWLGLRNIDFTVPDPTLYPEFDDVLKVAMVKETLLFFDEVLKNDLSLTNFVASDFTMLNGPLSKLYRIPNIEGLAFRKVTLPPNSHRGGVLTMASVMKVTANGTNTSPIIRGSWVLDRILGTPPPKPNVDVEAVEPDIRGATTIREQLAKHRTNATCASCHKKIDPPGFALESFDVIGGYREYYRSVGKGEPVTADGRRMRYLKGPAVDPADELPEGQRFANIDEFKHLLLKDKDQLARALAGKLLTYATGGLPGGRDRPALDAIVAKVRGKDYGLRTLVHEIVQSELFQSK
jgi:mono/diheme cytochrome c family protein